MHLLDALFGTLRVVASEPTCPSLVRLWTQEDLGMWKNAVSLPPYLEGGTGTRGWQLQQSRILDSEEELTVPASPVLQKLQRRSAVWHLHSQTRRGRDTHVALPRSQALARRPSELL